MLASDTVNPDDWSYIRFTSKLSVQFHHHPTSSGNTYNVMCCDSVCVCVCVCVRECVCVSVSVSVCVCV